VEHRLERVVVDLDQLERVLGEVAVAGDDDRERLAHVARGADGSGVVGDRRLDPGRKRTRERRDVLAGEDADDPRSLERRARVELHVCVRELGAEHRRVACVGHRVEVVQEATLAPQESVVLESRERPTHPRLSLDRDRHRANLQTALVPRSPSARGPIAAFAALGVFWGAFGVLLPEIKAATGSSDPQLGLALLAAALGTFPAMLLAGRLADRFGERAVAASLLFFAAVVLGP